MAQFTTHIATAWTIAAVSITALANGAPSQKSSSYFETSLIKTSAVVACEESIEYNVLGTCDYMILIQVELDNGEVKALEGKVNEAGGIRVGDAEQTILIGRLTEKEVEAISGAKQRLKDNFFKRVSGHKLEPLRKLEIDISGAISKSFSIAYGTQKETRIYRVPGYCTRSRELFATENCRKPSQERRQIKTNVWKVKAGKKEIVFEAHYRGPWIYE